MLKFFRKYNKQILVVGGVLLMVVFLIQPTISIFMPTGAGSVVTEIDGEPVTVGERRQAAFELDLLSRLHPVFVSDIGDDPMRWIKLKRRAAALSLSASEAEIGQAVSVVGGSSEAVARLAQSARTTPDIVMNAVGAYLAAARYRQLAAGDTGQSPVERLSMLGQAMMLEARAREYLQQNPGDFNAVAAQVQGVYLASEGYHRLSRPAVRHAIRDLGSRVGGRMALLDAQDFVDQAPEPTEADLQSLFERYRDVFEGQGEPYGFGYRLPDRIRVETLIFPTAAVAASVEVDEAEAVARYRENPERFESEGDADGPAMGPYPSSAVRDRVIETVRRERTREMMERITQTAVNLMRQPLRPLETEEGYKVLPEGFEPPALAEVAEEIEAAFDVRPQIRSAPDVWQSLREPEQYEPLGQTIIAGRQPAIRFIDYVRSARELEPAPDNALVPLRLQVGVPSEPMVDFTGQRWYIFRLVDADPGHPAESLDQVRDAVLADARRLAAFEMLADNAETYRSEAAEQDLEALAASHDGEVVPVSPRSRLAGRQGGDDPANDPDLLREIFELAAEIGPTVDLDALPSREKLIAVPLPSRLALAVFELARYEPVNQRVFAQQLGNPVAPYEVTALMEAEREGGSGPWLRNLDIGSLGEDPDAADSEPQPDAET